MAQLSAASDSAAKLARKLGLKLTTAAELAISRRRRGKGWSFVAADGKAIKDVETVTRLNKLAVPPAYVDVLYAHDAQAHLQATGRDVAGRLQYRYHPDWEKVREIRKARRLAKIAEALPKIRRVIGHNLAAAEPTRTFALSAVIELVACSAIRPGSESYAKLRGTRGATTLLKSNVTVDGNIVRLIFKAKGGKKVEKDCTCPRLVKALDVMKAVPGRRLFQYRGEDGAVRHVTAQDVNVFLREIAGVQISLKDFRTLLASAGALEKLSQTPPADTPKKRRKQLLEVVRATATDLANTPAICLRSYVHDTVVTAFEEGVLERFSDRLKGCKSPTTRAQVLAEIIAQAA